MPRKKIKMQDSPLPQYRLVSHQLAVPLRGARLVMSTSGADRPVLESRHQGICFSGIQAGSASEHFMESSWPN